MEEYDHLREMLRERDTRFQQRFEAQNEAIRAALASAEKAVTKAEMAAEKRFELLNELRAGVATRAELDALEKVVSVLVARVDKAEARGSGINAMWVYLLGAVAAIGTIVTLYVAFTG